MTTFFERNTTPFDILFKNFFESNSSFFPAVEAKISHPVDIYEIEDYLILEVACTGLTKEDIETVIEGDILKISYNKNDQFPTRENEYEGDDRIYIRKGIAKRSFNLGYKIANKYDLSLAEAEMKNGLLTITIPFLKESNTKLLEIK
jgi:HSP20 family molecular chaperone IbpA